MDAEDHSCVCQKYGTPRGASLFRYLSLESETNLIFLSWVLGTWLQIWVGFIYSSVALLQKKLMCFVWIPELSFLTNLHRISQLIMYFEVHTYIIYTHIYNNCKLYVGVSTAWSAVICEILLTRQ